MQQRQALTAHGDRLALAHESPALNVEHKGAEYEPLSRHVDHFGRLRKILELFAVCLRTSRRRPDILCTAQLD